MPGDGPPQPPPTEGAILLGGEAAEAREQLAKRAGIICSACGQPMNGDGWEYVTLHTDVREGMPTVVAGRAFICGRPSCTEPRAEMEQNSAARRPARPWHVFEDAPPPEGEDEAEAPEAAETD